MRLSRPRGLAALALASSLMLLGGTARAVWISCSAVQPCTAGGTAATPRGLCTFTGGGSNWACETSIFGDCTSNNLGTCAGFLPDGITACTGRVLSCT